MKTFLLIVALLLNYTLSFAASAPKKGVRMSVEVREAMRETAKFCGKGNHRVSWDASNITSGIYFYHLQAGEFVRDKKDAA